MKKIIANLKRQVANAKKYKNGMDEASWGYEQGVLITPNEALAILQAIRPVNKISSNVPVSGSLPSRDWLIETINEAVDEHQCLGAQTIADKIIERWEGNDH